MADKEEVMMLRKLIDAHRSTLNIYLEQLALHGRAYAPPHVISGIYEARSEIEQKKYICGVLEKHPKINRMTLMRL